MQQFYCNITHKPIEKRNHPHKHKPRTLVEHKLGQPKKLTPYSATCESLQFTRYSFSVARVKAV